MGEGQARRSGRCLVCNEQVSSFLPYGAQGRIGKCPHCGAKPRHRSLLRYLEQVVEPRLEPSSKILEVGPGRVSVERFVSSRAFAKASYTAIDVRALQHHRLLKPPHEFRLMSVCELSFPDDHFDLVICNNVLPYVADDEAALRQIARCLRQDGLAILETHRGAGPTYPVATHRQMHPELSDDYYGENGDQWVYGEDFLVRVRRAGLEPFTEVMFAQMDSGALRRSGLKSHNELLVAVHGSAGLRRFCSPWRGAARALSG